MAEKGVLLTDSWAGRQRTPVEIVGETPKRLRIRLLAPALMPSRGMCEPGHVQLVPKTAVKLGEAVTVRLAQTGMGERRHEFLQADGSWKRCGGPKFCRECNRESVARKAARRG